jgi:hypothetical protein
VENGEKVLKILNFEILKGEMGRIYMKVKLHHLRVNMFFKLIFYSLITILKLYCVICVILEIFLKKSDDDCQYYILCNDRHIVSYSYIVHKLYCVTDIDFS